MGAKHITPRVLMGQRRTPGEMARVRSLLRLARGEFGRLAWADRKVIVAAALGEVADFTDQTPDYAERWSEALASERALASHADRRRRDEARDEPAPAHRPRPVPSVEVDPAVVRWLLTDGEALPSVHAAGVQIRAALVPGLLNLEDAIAARPLWCFACVLGGVLLLGARCRTIGLPGCLVTEAEMPGSHPCAIVADRAEVGGGMDLRNGFRAEGEVRLLGARITGDLACDGGAFVKPGGLALNADRAGVGGGMFLRKGFRAEGEVRLLGARITGDLSCDGGAFVNPGGVALSADGARVEGTLFLRGIREVRGTIKLMRSRVGYLNDMPRASIVRGDAPAWPAEILLTDFRYDGIFPGAPLSAKDRLAWLANHDATHGRFYPSDPPDPQPYRQLAGVLKQQGREADARAVLFGYERCRARWHAERTLEKYPKLVRAAKALARAFRPVADRVRWVYRRTLGPVVRWLRPLLTITFPQVYRVLVGFGYYRWRALAWLLVLLVAGSIVFGYQSGRRMQPTQMLALREFESAHVQNGASAARAGGELTRRYPKFNALIYSADALIPLVSFHQEDYWTPRGDPAVHSIGSWWRTGGWWSGRWWTKVYLVFHISMGWVIATLFAASFTRLMRHD